MKRPSLEDIKQYIEEESNCKLLSTEYINSDKKLLLLCECGEEFEVAFKHFKFSNQRQCKKCGYKNGTRKQSYSQEEFVNIVKERLGEDYAILGQYKNSKTKIKMFHKTCGREYEQMAGKIIQGQRCSHCFANKKRALEEVQQEVKNICGNSIKAIGYNGSEEVILQCECGAKFTRPMTEIRKNKGAFCFSCKSSSGARLIEHFLKNNNIDYMREYKFEDCYYKKSLPFDFYIPKYNTLIEFDGEQHFRPLKHWGGEDKFKEIQLRDNIKNKYCLDNNIKLIRISYKQEDKIDKILQENMLIPR